MSTAELRREIAERRRDIGRDLEVIGDRVSPGRMAERTRLRARRRWYGMRNRVMGQAEPDRTSFGNGAGTGSDRGQGPDPAGAVAERVQGSPLAMGVVAFGLGFVAGSVFPASRTEREMAAEIEPGVTRVAKEAAEAARQSGEKLAPAVTQEMTDLRDEARQAAGEVAESARQEAVAAKDEATSRSPS